MFSQDNKLFIGAAGNKIVDRTPIWIMRQAGRYLPEYQELRRSVDFMQLCKTPELAVEASLMPLRRFALDAAIIFSDILIPVEAMGCAVDFTDQGPKIREPISTSEQIKKLTIPNPTEKMGFVLEAIRLLVRETGTSHPVLGFAGAPFTLAAYMIEGKPSHGFNKIRELIYQNPTLYHELAEKLTDTVSAHLKAQLAAGAAAVQLFDTWAGILSKSEYETFAAPYSEKIFRQLSNAGALSIHYIHGGPHLLDSMAQSSATVLSLDWRVDMLTAVEKLRPKYVLQGNLNPAALFSNDSAALKKQITQICQCFPEKRGHIFNLGHGIHQHTPIDNVKRMIDYVREVTSS
jgi:uroporphyrinogen decarboxylase